MKATHIVTIEQGHSARGRAWGWGPIRIKECMPTRMNCTVLNPTRNNG